MTLIWSTDNEGIATVSDTGEVSAVALGTAIITVKTTNGTTDTSDDKTATCTVVVIKAPTAKSLTHNGQAQEDNRREVKAAEGGLPVSLWETYSAMANTYGGVIICGVRERKDGSWFTTGMKDVQKLRRNFWNQINDSNKVSINLLREKDMETYEIDGDAILVIHVPAADRADKPVFINKDMFKNSFKRNNEGDYHCTKAEVQAMVRDQLKNSL